VPIANFGLPAGGIGQTLSMVNSIGSFLPDYLILKRLYPVFFEIALFEANCGGYPFCKNA
jgi:hypothetical protein